MTTESWMAPTLPDFLPWSKIALKQATLTPI
jgi:hypothetical protein